MTAIYLDRSVRDALAQYVRGRNALLAALDALRSNGLGLAL
jgi:hypothetical protein